MINIPALSNPQYRLFINLLSIVVIKMFANVSGFQLLCNGRSTFLYNKFTLYLYAGSAVQVFGLVQSSTQSLLLEEQECLTGAREAQGSIIDLTSQSCRALSPSFTPHIPLPANLKPVPSCAHKHTLRHTTTRTKHNVQAQRCLM